MGQIFEIHKYKGDAFMYVVARTNKHSEDYVKNDIEKMNNMLSPEMKAEGIHYVFALGTVDSVIKKTGERSARKLRGKQNIVEENNNNNSAFASINS
jgi:hypothetical protein